MPVSAIDPRTALIVVDLQNGFASLPTVHPFAAVVARASLLADAFRARQLPVVLVNNDGAAPGRREQGVAAATGQPGWVDLVRDLSTASSDHKITKRSPGAFTATDLLSWLQDRAVTQVVVAGFATGTGVEMTARQAYEAGFNVTLAIDAMTDLDPEVHANSVRRIFPRISETGTVEEIVKRLQTL